MLRRSAVRSCEWLLTHRKLLQSKAIAIDNDLRGTLRNFGLKVGVVGTVKFEARIKELVENLPDLAVLVEPLLMVRRSSGCSAWPRDDSRHACVGSKPLRS